MRAVQGRVYQELQAELKASSALDMIEIFIDPDLICKT